MPSLKQRLKNGEISIGPFLKITDPAVIETAAIAGFDHAIIDMEHGPISIETAQNLVRAAELRGLTPMARVPTNESSGILRCLDIGIKGVHVPHVSSKEKAEAVVDAIYFHPRGGRGVCRYVRAANYSSKNVQSHFKEANEDVLSVVHVEGLEGIKNLDKILSVEHLDVVFIGPYDLSQSCGIPGQVRHPTLLKKMEEVVKKVRKAKRAVGTFADNVEDSRRWINLGVQYICVSVDVGIFYEACSNLVKQIRAKS
jgi:4-hydroxy-2-oxoheptanedioate aldolase